MSESTVVKESASEVKRVEIAGAEVALTDFCTYKFQEACRILAEIIEHFGVKEIIDNLAGLGESPTMGQLVYAVTPLLPKILRQLPDKAREFVAVCCIPDSKLEELYDESGGIEAEVKSVSKHILFNSQPVEVTRALTSFIGCLQIEDLKNEMGQVAETFRSLTGQEEIQEKTTTKRRRRRSG